MISNEGNALRVLKMWKHKVRSVSKYNDDVFVRIYKVGIKKTNPYSHWDFYCYTLLNATNLSHTLRYTTEMKCASFHVRSLNFVKTLTTNVKNITFSS